MAPAGCCCFSNNVRQLVLVLATLSLTSLYANVILFNLTAVLHKDLDRSLQPVAGLTTLHEYTIWHDRKRRAIDSFPDANSTKDPDFDEGKPILPTSLTDFLDKDDGHPILPPTKGTPSTTTTTTTTPTTSKRRVIYITNSPMTSTTLASTTRRPRATPTSPTTTTTTTTAPTTRNVVLEEVQKAIDKYEKKDQPADFDSTPNPEKTGVNEDELDKFYPKDDVLTYVLRALVYAAPEIGCLIAAVPSMLALRSFGPRKLLPICLLVSGVLLLILPWIVPFGFIGIFIIRFLLGATFACALPVLGSIAVNWGTVREQLTFVAVQLLFFAIAPIASFPLTMLLYSNEVELFVVYSIHAGIAIFFAIIFYIFYRDRPQYHPWVNGLELNKIVAGKMQMLKGNRANMSQTTVLLRSLSAWAIWVASVGFFTAISFFATYLPDILVSQDVFLVDRLGLSSSLPFWVLPVGFIIAGIINRTSCSTSTAHVRIFNAVGFITTAIFFFIIPLLFHPEICGEGCQSLKNIIFLFSIFPLGLAVSGFLRSTTVLGRLHAQHIIGAMTIVWALVGIALPFTVNAYVHRNALSEWTSVFYIVAATLVVTAIVFAIFGRGRSAGWAETTWDPLINTKMRDLSPIDVAADECGLYEMRLIGPPKR